MAIFPACIKSFSSDIGKGRKWTIGKVYVAKPGKFEVCFNVFKHLWRSRAARTEAVQRCGNGSGYLISREADVWSRRGVEKEIQG